MKIIRDIFKDEKWNRYELFKKGKDSFGVVDRNDSFYNCFEEFEYYFGSSDFIKPMTCKEKIINEYNQTIKILSFGDDIKVTLYYTK